MGILEIHFHDSEFSWTMNTGTDRERSFSLGTGSESATAIGGETGRTSTGPKLRSFAVMALVIGAGIAFNRLRSRRSRERTEEGSRSRRLSLSRSK